MNAITTKRTQREDKDFKHLVAQLDSDLNARYQREQSKYDKYNQVDSIADCGCFKSTIRKP
ncbi:MAG: hypothetical protein LKI39_15285 [Bacteroides sp.]|jgi:hypothetical protein|nr:hypothetical protein [Bacteroides sp.]